VLTPSTKNRQARVLYDGHCAFCQKSVQLLRRLDWLGKLTYLDVRDEQELARENIRVNPDRLLEEMHLVAPHGRKIYHGFGAVCWIAWRLPALWLFAPLMQLPGVPEAGQKLYLWVARNRFQLIPCHGGICTLPHHARPASRNA
jgi:predicted DCC family thiol-disulfide oxidoreductase YuxK